MNQRLWIAVGTLLMLCAQVAAAADTASITARSDDGLYVGLDDGTKWLVGSSDTSTVSGWSVGDEVVEVDASAKCAGTELVNTDEQGEEVCARSVGSHTASITEKSDDGAYLSLDDGTQWLISDVDRTTSTTWLVTDDVLYVKGSKTCPEIEIINVDEDGDEVCAHAIK